MQSGHRPAPLILAPQQRTMSIRWCLLLAQVKLMTPLDFLSSPVFMGCWTEEQKAKGQDEADDTRQAARQRGETRGSVIHLSGIRLQAARIRK